MVVRGWSDVLMDRSTDILVYIAVLHKLPLRPGLFIVGCGIIGRWLVSGTDAYALHEGQQSALAFGYVPAFAIVDTVPAVNESPLEDLFVKAFLAVFDASEHHFS